MKRRLALSLSALMAFSPMAQAAPPVEMPPGYRPAPDSDEAGLWMLADNAEKEIRASPRLVRDEALNAYVKELTCKIVAEYCGSLRIYIFDEPSFNAYMAANGMMVIHTGLLLRTESEAQLAFAVGHEFAHYRLRHSVNQFRTARDGATAMAVFTLAASAAGVGLVGSLAQLAMLNSYMSYNRDQEREADAYGFDLVVSRGYDPRSASRIWVNVSSEEKAHPKRRDRLSFLASHPEPDERAATLTEKADKASGQRADWVTETDRYRAVIAPHRTNWLSQTVESDDCNAALIVLNRLLESDPQSGELRYFLGETYRRRNMADDMAKARQAYQESIAASGPAAAYKGLGITTMKAGDNAAAKSAFEHYLAQAPSADDRAMVEFYLSRL